MNHRNRKYPEEMTKTPEGQKLLVLWHRIKKEVDQESIFTEYPMFYRWAMDHYFGIGARLRRLDPLEPYAPDNCEVYFPQEAELQMSLEQRRQINKWNRTVNVIRKYYGMSPFKEVSEEAMNGRYTESTAPDGAVEEGR